MPLATLIDVAPQRTTLENSITDLESAITLFDTTHYSGALLPVPTPIEITRLLTRIGRIKGQITALATTHSHNAIENFYTDILELRDDVDNAHYIDPLLHAEWKRYVMSLAKKMEQQSDKYISKASGSWVRRKTRKWLDAVGLTEHRRDTTKRFLWRHTWKIAGAAGAGAILWWALQMDGCTPSREMPPTGSWKPGTGEYHPVNKRDSGGGQEYDGSGKNFSVKGFLSASKTTFANGASPEAQAFQGVWNYIDEHRPDEKWWPGERFHFHTTPTQGLDDTTHYDVNAYTGGHDTKVIEITWQKDAGNEVKGGNDVIEELNAHTWRYTLHANGTIEKTNVYHDGRGEKSFGIITKQKFQADLGNVQGF